MSDGILVIIEQQDGKLNRMSLEALTCAQQISGQTSKPVEAVVLGHGARSVAEEIAANQVATVRLIDDPLLDWLDLYAEAQGFLRDDRRPDYDPRTDFTQLLSSFGSGRGVDIASASPTTAGCPPEW